MYLWTHGTFREAPKARGLKDMFLLSTSETWSSLSEKQALTWTVWIRQSFNSNGCPGLTSTFRPALHIACTSFLNLDCQRPWKQTQKSLAEKSQTASHCGGYYKTDGHTPAGKLQTVSLTDFLYIFYHLWYWKWKQKHIIRWETSDCNSVEFFSFFSLLHRRAHITSLSHWKQCLS